MDIKNQKAQGFFYAVSSFVVWGFFPIFFKLFDESVSAYEILAHRIIWSVFFMSIVLLFIKKLQNIKILLQNKSTRKALFLSGLLISANWGVYVYAVANDKILEASLGYFINPLMNIIFGFLVFKEKISKISAIAIFIVIFAIGVQIYALKALPVISLLLPITFALYGVVRKQIRVAALEGLFIETLLVLPFALGYVFYLSLISQNHFTNGTNTTIMIISGIATVVPLLAFNAATTRINLSTIGYIQYLSPTLSMLCGVFLFHEELGFYRGISFVLIWIALFLSGFGTMINTKSKS
ncbi:EamA family transporter RarD [Campylobacter californiensis]|uniref:EamA family transporter RarD n=1 Tax=Campylobacter californiensis TaxID=1032243 RepID=UPI0014728CC0|nr:EamA family transporter RarD [Campylobacter sp. RM12916]MBE3609174.1 EamA family transporter RarD [Campylobacter sp. RM12916]